MIYRLPVPYKHLDQNTWRRGCLLSVPHLICAHKIHPWFYSFCVPGWIGPYSCLPAPCNFNSILPRTSVSTHVFERCVQSAAAGMVALFWFVHPLISFLLCQVSCSCAQLCMPRMAPLVSWLFSALSEVTDVPANRARAHWGHSYWNNIFPSSQGLSDTLMYIASFKQFKSQAATSNLLKSGWNLAGVGQS